MRTLRYLRPLILTTLLGLTACGGTPDGSEHANSRSDDVASNQNTDSDNDGVNDTSDAFPSDASETIDSDLDGIGNNTDTDDDGDGVIDSSDTFPLDANETIDTDLDGIGNNTDTDDDGDGVIDSSDAFPLDANETIDSDLDGIGNNTDTDDDGDGVNDIADACPLDPTETLDSDGDGICDNADLTPSSTIDELISGGVVGGFGSIYVNGIRYSTDTAEFVNDDNQSLINGEQHLEVGHYVWIQGTINDDGATGIANVVIYDVNLKGAVGTIDPPNRSFTVLGRTVKISQDTIFDNDFAIAELSGLTVGENIEVSGFDQTDGSLLATRIDLQIPSAPAELKVEGLVTQVDSLNRTLLLGTQVIDFSNAVINFSPSTQQWIEVYGSLDPQNVIIARVIQLEAHQTDYGLSATNSPNTSNLNTRISVEGSVTDVNAGSGFSVNGYPVLTSTSTLYIGGNSTDVKLASRVLIQGLRSADLQTLVAEHVYIRLPENLQIEGLVTAIDRTTDQFDVAGITVAVQTTTQMEDGTGVDRRFRTQNLVVGDFVEVSGQYTGDLLIAYRIGRDDNDDDLDDYAGHAIIADGVQYHVDDDGFLQDPVGNYHIENDGTYTRYSDTTDYLQRVDNAGSTIEIQGIASAFSTTALTLYGNVINFTNSTTFGFNNRIVDSATFFASTVSNPYVEVNATVNQNNIFEALTVNLESPTENVSESNESGSDDSSRVAEYGFELKGIITAIDTSSLQLSNGYNLQFTATTTYETYSLVNQATFLSTLTSLINPAVELKVVRSTDGTLRVTKIELESSEISDDRGEAYTGSQVEFEGYGAINELGVTMQGNLITFLDSTYFELFDRQVSLTEFLAHVSNTDRFEVKARRNTAGAYEAIKVELDD